MLVENPLHGVESLSPICAGLLRSGLRIHYMELKAHTIARSSDTLYLLNPLHGVESWEDQTGAYLSRLNPLHGVERVLVDEVVKEGYRNPLHGVESVCCWV